MLHHPVVHRARRPTAPCSPRWSPEDPPDQRRGRDEEHDEGLHHQRMLVRSTGRRTCICQTTRRTTHRTGGRRAKVPQRRRPAEQGDGDGVEAEVPATSVGQRPSRCPAPARRRPRPARAPAMSSQAGSRAVNIRAGGASRLGVGAGRAEFEAERGAVEQPRNKDRGRDGQQEPRCSRYGCRRSAGTRRGSRIGGNRGVAPRPLERPCRAGSAGNRGRCS